MHALGNRLRSVRQFYWLASLVALAIGQPLRGDPLPSLGQGDPGLLVGLTAADRKVWVIAREKNTELYPDFTNGKNVGFVQVANGTTMLCSDHPDQVASILFGSLDKVKQQCSTDGIVYRCFPLGPGRGIIQQGFVPGNPVMVSWKGEVAVAATMTADQLKSFGVRPGERILGEIDGRRFYWSKSRPTVVVARDLENNPVGEWTVPRLAIPDGVVRGLTNPKSVAVVGDFKARGLIKWGGQYDYAIIDIEGYR